jgi:hypothetical protein
VRVTSGINPYLQRWVAPYHYLRDNCTGWTWFTDGTDVEMLREPWDMMQPGTLYVGHEPTVLGIAWMLNHHKPYQAWIKGNADLNCRWRHGGAELRHPAATMESPRPVR